MRSRLALIVLLLTAAALRPLVAQALSAEALEAIHHAATARVRLAGEGWRPLAGTAADSAGTTAGEAMLYITGRAGEAPGAIPLSRVAQVQVKAGSHAGKGAKIGAAIGLGLSLLAVAAASGDSWTSPTTGEAVAATVSTTAFGAGIGALVGLTSPRWRTVYGIDPP
jgi:hypothetical protein